jgi:O-antigen/teichoic acid export membrane protein
MALYSRGKARRSLIDTVVYRAVSQIATLLSFVVLVRGMSKEEFGVLNLLYAFIPVISTVASLGLEQALRRYQPEYLRAGNQAAAVWLVRFVASTRFVTNVIFLGLVLLVWNVAAPLFKLTPYRAEFVLFCLLILLHFQARILQLSLASHMLQRYSVGSVVLLSVVKLAAYSLLAWQDSLTLVSAIVSDTVAFAATYVFLTVAYRRRCLPSEPLESYRPPPDERRRLLKYGLFNNFNDAGTYVLSLKSDNFFIAALIDPISVGIYSFYTRLSGMAAGLLPVRLFDNVVQPLFFAILPEEAQRRIPAYFSLLLNTNLMLQLPILVYAICYHTELVRVIFGGKFVEHSWLLPFIVGFATINVMAIPVTLVAQYEEKAGIILLGKIFGVYNVVALLVLLPIAGLYGAALASGSAQALKNLFVWWHVRDKARWLNGGAVVLASLTVWGGAAGICYLVKSLVRAPEILQLLMGAVICGIAALLYMRSPAVSASDRRILGTVLAGREARLLQMLGLAGRAEKPATQR